MKRLFIVANVIVGLLVWSGCKDDDEEEVVLMATVIDVRDHDVNILSIRDQDGLNQTGDRTLSIDYDVARIDPEQIYLEYATGPLFPTDHVSSVNYLAQATMSDHNATVHLPTKGKISTWMRETCESITANDSSLVQCIINAQSDWDGFLEEKRAYVFKDNVPIYYRWVFEMASGEKKFGDVHKEIVPRTLLFANVGDSFGSGEGAGTSRRLDVSSGWLQDHNGETCHRSKWSGQSLMLKDIAEKYKYYAVDSLNVACTGAVIKNIFLTKQYSNDIDWNLGAWVAPFFEDGWSMDAPKKTLQTKPQLEMVKDWMESNGYTKLDGLMVSGGGNDVDFSDMIKNYIGATFDYTAMYGIFPLREQAFTSRFHYLTDAYGSPEQTFSKHLDDLEPKFMALTPFVSSNLVFVQEYPNLLANCNRGYYETLHSYIPLVVPWPPFSIVDPSLQFRVSKGESEDIRTHISPRASDDVNGRGLNGRMAFFIPSAQATAIEGQEWFYVYNNVENINGICKPVSSHVPVLETRYFNTVKDALYLGGHWKNLWGLISAMEIDRSIEGAFHPNVTGHKEIYFPNLKASIYQENALDENYLKESYTQETLLDRPDLSVDEAQTTITEVLSENNLFKNQVQVEATFMNTGILDANDIRVKYALRTKASNHVIPLDTTSVYGIRGNDYESNITAPRQRESNTFNVPEDSIFSFSKFHTYNAGDVADIKAKVLAWNFPQQFYVSIEIDPEGSVDEINEHNNMWTDTTTPISIIPTVTREEVVDVFSQLNNACSTRFGVSSPIPDSMFVDDVNIDHYCIRDFFGLATPWIDSNVGESIVDASILEDVIAQEERSRVTDENSKTCIAINRGSVKGVIKQCIKNDESLDFSYLDLPEDNRILQALIYDAEDPMMQKAKAFEVQTESRNGRIVSANNEVTINQSEPNNVKNRGYFDFYNSSIVTKELTSRTVNFTWSPSTGGVAYQMTVGTRRGGGDIFVGELKEDLLNVTVENIPQDGRDVYVTLYTKREDVLRNLGWSKEEYLYKTSVDSPPMKQVLFYDDGKSRFEFSEGTTSMRIGSKEGADDFGTYTIQSGVVEVTDLPEDGRVVYVTTEKGERYQVQLADHYPGLVYPLSSHQIDEQQQFVWNLTRGDVHHFELKIGLSKDSDDVYNNTTITPEKSSIIIDLESLIPLIVTEQTVYVSFTTVFDDGTEHTEYYQYTYGEFIDECEAIGC